jgi:phosphoribosylglycinamide formyltransferase-1
VAQAALPVLAGDTAQTLAERVLTLEHQLYPRAVRWFAEGKLSLRDGRAVLASDEVRAQFSDSPIQHMDASV